MSSGNERLSYKLLQNYENIASETIGGLSFDRPVSSIGLLMSQMHYGVASAAEYQLF